ncbi:hypothetical protein [Embleya sp. MST-111070]|uniref:hypothetical protein n=1 Tax=Embleya sp. MST-111070 TaxID=3398231 RepID=UPI003F7394FD
MRLIPDRRVRPARRALPAPDTSRGPRAGRTLRTARALLPTVVRAIDWIPFLAVAPIAVWVAAVGAPRPDEAVTCLRVAAVLLGAASAVAPLDPMESSTAALPVPRALRQGLRTLVALLPIALVWGVAAVVVTRRSPAALPWVGLTLEAAVLAVATVAAAAWAVHRVPGRTAALIAIGTVLTLVTATLALPISPWPEAGAPDWTGIHLAWAAALPVAVLVLLRANHRPFGRLG